MLRDFICGNCGEVNKCDPDNPKKISLMESREQEENVRTFYFECNKCGKLNTVRLKVKS